MTAPTATPAITRTSLEDMLRKNEGLSRKDVMELKAWKAEHPYLPRVADGDLGLFVVNNEFDPGMSKCNFMNYFLMRHYSPELFAARDEVREKAIKSLRTVLTVELPSHAESNQRVIYSRLLDTDPMNYDFGEAVKALNMILDSSVYENGPSKFLLILDLNGVTMGHRKSLKYMGLKKFFEYMLRGGAFRMGAVHYVNSAGAGGDPMIQQFIKDSVVGSPDLNVAGKVFLHESIEAMCKDAQLDRALLPDELGGKAGSLAALLGKQEDNLQSNFGFLESMEDRTKLLSTRTVPTVVNVFGEDKDF